jgi:hypothetical protein
MNTQKVKRKINLSKPSHKKIINPKAAKVRKPLERKVSAPNDESQAKVGKQHSGFPEWRHSGDKVGSIRTLSGIGRIHDNCVRKRPWLDRS